MTRTLANTHALASQVIYAAQMAVEESQLGEEVERRLQQIEGLTDWERGWVRDEVAFRLAVSRARK